MRKRSLHVIRLLIPYGHHHPRLLLLALMAHLPGQYIGSDLYRTEALANWSRL